MDDRPLPVDPRLTSCLQQMVQAGASDLFLVAGAPPTLKQQGQFVALGAAAIAAPDVCAMAYSVMSVAQRVAFEACMECDLAYQTDRGDRFRINVHRQRGQVGMVVRGQAAARFYNFNAAPLYSSRPLSAPAAY